LHAAERIHFVLFIATTVYFLTIAVTFWVYKVRLQRYSWLELLEAKARIRGDTAENDAPSTWVARFQAWRQASTSRRLHAIREYLRDYKELADEFEEASKNGVKNSDQILSVRAFIQRTSGRTVGNMIAFPLATWAVLLLATIVLAVVSRFGCLTMYQVNIMVSGYFYTSSFYIVCRIMFFRVQLQRRLRLPLAQRKRGGQDAWPCPVIDRLFFWALSGVSGYAPHKQQPSETHSLYLIQASLWYQCYFWALLMSEPSTYSSNPDFLKQEGGAMRLASFAAIVLWGVFILPEMMELYALPPYLDDGEQKYVFEVLHKFPEGYCPEDEEIHAAKEGGVWKPMRRTRTSKSLSFRGGSPTRSGQKLSRWGVARQTLMAFGSSRQSGRKKASRVQAASLEDAPALKSSPLALPPDSSGPASFEPNPDSVQVMDLP
jgi:hypothetical protein